MGKDCESTSSEPSTVTYRDQLGALRDRLRNALHTGEIKYPTYVAGMHVARAMQMARATECVLSWLDMEGTAIAAKGCGLVVPPLRITHYELIQALQQLHEVIGVASHVSRAMLLEELRESKLYHFSRDTDSCSELLGKRTLLVFLFVEELGADVAAEAERMRDEALLIPRWLS